MYLCSELLNRITGRTGHIKGKSGVPLLNALHAMNNVESEDFVLLYAGEFHKDMEVEKKRFE